MCEGVEYRSATFDPFLDLSLEITKAQTLTRALQHFTAEEVLDGDNRYRCPKNNKLVSVGQKGLWWLAATWGSVLLACCESARWSASHQDRQHRASVVSLTVCCSKLALCWLCISVRMSEGFWACCAFCRSGRTSASASRTRPTC